MIEFFELMIDKSDLVDLAAAIENGDRATARGALDRLLAAEISGDARSPQMLTEWIAQGRAAAAKGVR